MADDRLTKDDVLELIPRERLHDAVDDFFHAEVYADFANMGWGENRPYSEVLAEFLAETIAREVSRSELAERGWIKAQ